PTHDPEHHREEQHVKDARAQVSAWRLRDRLWNAAHRSPSPPVECAATMPENDITGTAPAALPRTGPSPAGAVGPLIDIGINLAHDSYDADREAVIARAAAAGVAQMIVTGSSATSSRSAISLARQHAGRLFATAGVHPHHATELTCEALTQLGELTVAPEVVAVGECGLDYYRNYSPHAAQREAFERQLELAGRCGKPVFLHQRDAHEDFIAILRGHWPAAWPTASRAAPPSWSVIWSWDSRSASPVGSATRGAVRTCSSSCGASRPSACSSRRTARTCCRGTCSQSPPRGGTSRCIFRTSPRPWPARAASRPNRWRSRARRPRDGSFEFLRSIRVSLRKVLNK